MCDGNDDAVFNSSSLGSCLCKSVNYLVALDVHIAGDPLDVTEETAFLHGENDIFCFNDQRLVRLW